MLEGIKKFHQPRKINERLNKITISNILWYHDKFKNILEKWSNFLLNNTKIWKECIKGKR